MTYSIKLITDKAVWEDFLLNQEENSFLQSWNYGEMMEKLGNRIFRLGAFEKDKKLIGICLAIKIKARRGTYLHVPYGPIINFSDEPLFSSMVQYVKKLGREEKCHFIRANPMLNESAIGYELFKKFGFRSAPVHLVNPELSWIKDISEDEDLLFQNLKKETRYEIRKAQKLNIEIKKSTDISALDAFYALHTETVARHKFIPFSYQYLKAQLETFRKDDQVLIFLAEFEGKPISSAIIVFYGNEASYHHAASSSQYQKLPASYLIQWEVIRTAKKRKCSKYNFWGIVENNPNHPWAGLSLFKKKFGGYEKRYIHVQDYPLSWFYWFNWVIEKARKVIRNY